MKKTLIHHKSAVTENLSPFTVTPFADLMLHPEKLEATLKTAKNKNGAFLASGMPVQSPTDQAEINGSSQSQSIRKSFSHSSAQLKKTEFYLKARFAKSVKIAGDFTDWGKFPIDMIKSNDDVWSMFVPLAPGTYAYRFIIDGEWCDDPHSALQESNPFGTNNALVKVT